LPHRRSAISEIEVFPFGHSINIHALKTRIRKTHICRGLRESIAVKPCNPRLAPC
jgi:hypothetical protein